MIEESETPSLGDVIDLAILGALGSFRVALPARVESYNAAEQSANLQVLTLVSWEDENGVRKTERLPVINRVPVLSLGAGGFRMRFPIKKGDLVLAIFASSSLDRWKTKGGEVDPLDVRTGDLSDAIAIPGVHDFAHALDSAPSDRMIIGSEDGVATIEITETEILAGGSSKLALLSELNTLRSHVATLLVGGSGSATNATAPAAFDGTAILKGG